MEKNNYKSTILSHMHHRLKATGFSQIALGIAVILIAIITSWVSVKTLGMILIIWAALEIIPVLRLRGNNAIPHIVWCCIIAGIGTLLIVLPGIGAAVISLMLAVLFIFGGVYKMIVVSRDQPNWGWSSAGSVASMLLGLFILTRWPITNFVLLGILIGIEILLNGWSISVIEYAEKRVKKTKMA
ncbi:MAG TPA: DUF308 domain-containing protein [Chitinispirillaceae bacterium]|nr:DUF308 domain-containing protein [Chitinispirillaceae bacterium]